MISIGTGHSSGTVGTDTQRFPTVEASPAIVERVRVGEDWHTCAVPLSLVPARIAALHGGNPQKPTKKVKAKKKHKKA